MDALVDWMQFTYKQSLDCEPVPVSELIETFLGVDADKFEECKGRFRYKSGLYYSNIWVFYDGISEDMGVHFQISGQGCRFLESREGWKWDFLFSAILLHKCNVSRLDIAIDDKDYLNLDIIKEHLDNDKVVTRFKDYGELRRRKFGGDYVGRTFYLGSRESEFSIRIYDKKLESDGKIDAIRLECEIRQKKALNFIVKYMEQDIKSLGWLIRQVLNNYIRFVDEKKSNSSRSQNSEWWDKFVETSEKLSLGHGVEELTVQKVESWLERQTASNIKLLAESKGEDYARMFLTRIANRAKLNDRQKRAKDRYIRVFKAVNE